MSRQLATVIHWLRQVAASGVGTRPPGLGAASDQHLLDGFITHQDKDAFAELVQRHGPMVLAVCRRLLSNSHDAEDAFQATFLVLVRKATSIAKRASVGSWLHGVAYRIAAKARSRRFHQRSREREIVDMPVAEPLPEMVWQDVRAVLDEEVGRLPEKYRSPFVLCYLEGKTNEEAAQHLRCPKGTIATRLARARELLRQRLGHRGVTLSAGLFATLLVDKALPAAVPGTLTSATVKAAMVIAAGKMAAGVISASVVSLMESGVKTMAITKVKIALAVCLTVSTLGIGAGILSYQSPVKERLAEKKPAAPERKAASPRPAAEKETITGTVVDADGRPAKGIEVRVYRWGDRLEKTLSSDDQGRIQVPKAWDNRDDHYSMIVEMEERLGLYSLPDCSDGNQGKPVASFRIRVLPRTKTIQGTLLDSKNRPLPKVTVKVLDLEGARYYLSRGKNPLGEAVTDDQGRFSLKVPEYTYCWLSPADPGLIRKRLNPKPNQPDLGRIVVAEAGVISGRVTDAKTGKPIVGVSVGAQFLGSDVETGGYGQAQTDEEGRYEIPSLRPGLYNVLISGPREDSKITAPAREAVRVEAGKKASVDFRAAEGRLLTGTLVGKEDTKPIANCHVGYYGAARPRSGAACMMVRTDSQGRFRFYVPPGTAYVYVAESRGPFSHDSTRTLDVPADKDPDPLQLISYSTIQNQKLGETRAKDTPAEGQKDYSYILKVSLRSKDGLPVVGALVWLWAKEQHQWSLVSAAQGNELELPLREDNKGKTFYLIIEAPGWARPKPPEFVAAKVMQPLVIDMEPATYVPIRGRVVDIVGKPIANALVRVGLILSHEAAQFPWGVEPQTDSEGRFELKQLRPQDEFTLQISKKGYDTLASKHFTVKQNQRHDLGTFKLLVPGQSAEATIGKPAPAFAVSKWIGKEVSDHSGYASQDFRGKVVLLAFMDEARPSERLLKQLNSLHQNLAEKGLIIVRVYESGTEADLSKLSPTVAALAGPELLSDGSSEAAEKYGVKARPTLFLVDREGILRHADLEPGRSQEPIEGLLKR